MIVNSSNALEILQDLYIASKVDDLMVFATVPFMILQLIVFYKVNQLLKEYIENNKEYL